jgi:hypothetical protein
MKKLIFLFVSCILISCSKSDEPTQNLSESSEFLGKWKLKQVLNDPGDGSGVYENVAYDAYLTMNSDGTVTLTNQTFCPGSQIVTALYYADENKIIPSCYGDGFSIVYELQEGNLILSYPCIESCLSKYEKVIE